MAPPANLLPGAIWRPSSIEHPMRPATLGITVHWTVGVEPGDISVLDGPNVDCQLYVAKDGDLYQFLDLDEQGWHGRGTANRYTVGIEHEGKGEPWTPEQLATSARAAAAVCRRYAIPVVKCDPSGTDLSTFRGLFGHRDLSLGGVRVDGNDHTDTVPDGTGWATYLAAINRALGLGQDEAIDLDTLPKGGTLRLHLAGRVYRGWGQAAGPIEWVARNGAEDPDATMAWNKRVFVGPRQVTGVCRHLAREYLGWSPR